MQKARPIMSIIDTIIQPLREGTSQHHLVRDQAELRAVLLEVVNWYNQHDFNGIMSYSNPMDWAGIACAEVVASTGAVLTLRLAADLHAQLDFHVCNIPAGPFLMGDDEGNMSEQPAHTVDLPGYAMMTFPVTVRQYALAMEWGGLELPDEWDAQRASLESPIVGISFDEALHMAAWVNEVARLSGDLDPVWRLPSEAEWEKAARGTDGRLYPWGNNYYDDRSHTADCDCVVGYHPVPVSSHPEDISPYGVRHLGGNVRCWCNSGCDPYPFSPTTVPDPSTTSFAIRGNSYRRHLTTVSWRSALYRGHQFEDVGIRLVRA
jgi:formylglycine-generating enzyme required for sulfatase activity